MSGASRSSTQPILDEETRSFVRRSLSAGLLTVEEIKTVVASLMTDDLKFTPQRLADGLVGAGRLTRWQANKLIAGKSKGFYLGVYKLLRPLGKGGMGVVYLGEHHVMKRQMALKILPSEALSDGRRIERFKEEARASAQLDHPNIVRAYDFNQAGSKLYIVMEYVEGIDLHHIVARDGVMSIDAAVDATYQAASGLAHAHERGIIHRDVKPSNLMLRSDGVVKVSDLGLARIGWTDDEALREEKNKRLMGTADFVAPEQALNSKTVDARADIYSLGCTLYFLLTGKAPFGGQSVAQRLAKHQTAVVPDARELRPDCPASLATLLIRMMAKKPSDRPASMAEFLNQLERIRGGSAQQTTQHDDLAALASTRDTVIDERVYQATIEDTSLSGDAPVEVVEVVEEFDFGSLPPIEPVVAASGPSSVASGGKRAKQAPPSFPAQGVPRPPGRPQQAAGNQQASGSANGSGQMIMLGIGLAVAVLALVTVVGVGAYTFTRPLEKEPPKIKAVEDGKGGYIVVPQ